ncbi:nicotinate (nicotinamide) nucleotide adenylyltransferase [Filimonas effusa]|uniref:Probable nicotinate-nucleotide adenylyltransferase n=1 Tax=Filimonas effusa TaxID=2508721 RepID=A0A4Q1D1Y9_9BACT|nr:nicotinate (nicotinamide) nucleotide adenylyltransferase [Filimonas effusa]RXK81019.1 nicotinate-nucleotide adenylyltransferase [Filimonas effusa]
MKIGLYFGSFNPIHVGHLIIASYIINEGLADQLWFVVSPHNPLKPSASLLNEYQRLHLVRLAIEEDERFKVSDVEFKLPKPSYTIDTLTYLHEKYPQNDFSVVMGSDSFQNLPKWKNFETLVRDYKFIVYNRPGYKVSDNLQADLTVVNAPLLEMSATVVRQLVKQGKSLRYMVPEKVRMEIEGNGYYK